MSDEIVFDVLCTKVLDALRALGLGKFSIRNYYYEGMWPIIKVYRSEGVIFYSAAFTNEIVNRFHLDHENGLVADRIWAKVRKASILFEEYVQTGKIVWKRVRPDPKISLSRCCHRQRKWSSPPDKCCTAPGECRRGEWRGSRSRCCRNARGLFAKAPHRR